MKLKEFFNLNSKQGLLVISLFISIGLLAFGGFSYQNADSKIQKLESLRNGSTICTNRVGQSHYGLLSGADTAQALTDNYFSATDECFSQFDHSVDELSFKTLATLSNEIYDEFISYKNMAKNFGTGNVPLTRISNSYNKIDQIRFDLGIQFSKEIKIINSSKVILRYIIVFAILLMGFAISLYLIALNIKQRKIDEIEKDASMVETDYSQNGLQIERLIERAIDQLNMPAIKGLFLEYNTYMLEKAYPNQRAIEYKSPSTNAERKEDLAPEKRSFEMDEDYINSVFDVSNSHEKHEEEVLDSVETLELTAADLELDDDELEDQWVSVSSLGPDESSIEFQLVEEFNEMIKIDGDPTERFSETEMIVIGEEDLLLQSEAVSVSHSENIELKQISRKVREILGEVVTDEPKMDVQRSVQFDNPIGQKIDNIINSKENVSPIEEEESVSFQNLVSKITKAYLKREIGADLKWEFATDYIDFEICDEQESIEQILYSIMTRFEKGFKELEFSANQKLVRVVSMPNERGGQEIQLRCKGLLFNTAELEFLNHSEQSVRRLIDLNLVMTQELMQGLGGDISLRNELGDGNVKEGIMNLLLPLGITSREAKKQQPILTRIVSGTKTKLLKSLRRETII